MSCNITTEEKQTEYEFFCQLLNNPALNSCCGPLVPVSFTPINLKIFCQGLQHLAVQDNYLDSFQTLMLDSGIFLIVMCSKHWIVHSTALAQIGYAESVPEWGEVSHYLFRLVCELNKWDYKEIMNYLKTVETAKHKGMS